MRLPAKIEYACKAIMELGLHYQLETPVQLNEISVAQQIPKQFLVQLMIRLKNAGLVKSTRGMAGGYSLTRAPAFISLADVFRAIDDSIITNGGNKKYRLDSGRLISQIWEDISHEVSRRLEERRFDYLISKLKKEPVAYSI